MRPETRETVLFLAGLLAFAYILLVPSAPRDWSIIILIGGMMGVPAVLPLDRKRNGEKVPPVVPPDDDVHPARAGGGSGGPSG